MQPFEFEEDFHSKMAKEQVKLLYLQAPVSNLTIIGIGLLFFLIMQDQLSILLMATWTVVLTLSAVIRLLLWYFWKNASHHFSSKQWLSHYIVASGVVGLCWCGLYLFEYGNQDIMLRSAIFMLFFAIIGASVSILSISMMAFILYTFPQVVTLGVVLLTHQNKVISLLVLGLAIYYVMMIIFARNSNLSLLKTIKLQLQNGELIQQLNREINHREELVSARTEQLAIANRTIASSETRLKNVIACADLGFWDWDYATGHHEVSTRWLSILGLKQEEIVNQLCDWSERIHQEDKVHVQKTVNHAINNKIPYRVEFRMRHKNGHWVWIEGSGAVVEYDQDSGDPIRLCGTHQDITIRKQVEQQLKEQHQFIQNVIDGVNDEVMVINQDYTVPLMNKAARNSINPGFIKEQSNPKCYEILHHQSVPCHIKGHPCPLLEVMETGNSISVIHNHYSVRGDTKSVELTATPLHNEKGLTYAIIESAHDITSLLNTQNDLKEHVEALDHLAHHDMLTKLPNRLLFKDRLRQAIKKSHRHQQKIAVLFIDLDRFKEINDSLGHRVGDEVLSVISARLKSCVREADTVARLGGDEFTIIIDSIADTNVVTDIAEKIIHSIAEAIPIKENNLYVTTSIGISIFPDDGSSAGILLRNADAAMYKAKDMGKNTYRYYTEDMTQRAYEHILLESSLRQALDQKHLVVHYQPQFNSKTQQITGIEALVRWQHDKQGLISPAKFIPLAEDTGLIVPLGEQVLDMAVKQMVQWMQGKDDNCRMAINLSVKQLQAKNITDQIAQILQRYQCNPNWLELEITEGYIMNDPEQAIHTLKRLKNMGFKISIDDFGTGYSSLSYLKRLPIDKLKIDQSFIRDIANDEDDKIIVEAIISLAQSMNLEVIAEGVETPEQRQLIEAQGCNLMQGYLFSRPICCEEMTLLLAAQDTS